MNLFEILFQGQNFIRILSGLGTTLSIAVFSTILSVLFGSVFGFLLLSKNSFVKTIAKLYLEFFRIIPQLVLLFVFYYGLNSSFTPFEVCVFVFTLWGLGEFGDLVRSSVLNVKKLQIDSAKALGLSNFQVKIKVVLPQSLRMLLPVTVNLITRIVKTTAIVPLIGVVEVLKVGQQIVDYNRVLFPTASISVYALIFFLYFIICFPLSLVSKKFIKN